MNSRALSLSVAFLVTLASGCDPLEQETSQSTTIAKPGQQSSVGNESITQLIEQLNSEDDAVQAAAVTAIAALGDGAAPAVDALIVRLKNDDPRVRALAARALGQIGKPAASALEPLAALVGDDDATVRRLALAAISSIDPGDEMVVPLLIKTLQDADPDVVAMATHRLAEAGPRIVPPMIKAMDDDRTIYWAILVLAEIGPDGKDAVPALAKALSHKDPEVRHEAAQALRAMGPDASPAVPELITALDDDQVAVRMPAVLALGSIGPGASDALAQIQSLTESDDDLLKVCALWAFEKIDPNPERLETKTTPALVNFLLNEDSSVRSAAALAVLQLEPGPEVVAPLFADVFAKATVEARADMIDAAASLGGQAVPRLIPGLGDPNVRQQVIRILGTMGPDAAEAVPELLKYATAEDPATRADVFIALGKIGPAAKAATEAATEALRDSEEEVQSSAVFALGGIGPDAVASVDEIMKLMDRGNPRLTTVCAWALVNINPEDHECCNKAIPLLIEALNDDQAFVRIEAASTLGTIGHGAKEALPSLEKLSDDPDPSVREAASEAITKLKE